jgi:hypothetical protein
MECFSLAALLALIGALSGVSGLVLGIVNYLRDRFKLVITLKWDMAVTDNARYDTSKKWGIVSAANVGRRPVYIRVANLELPKGYEETHLVLNEGIRGIKLAEGDAPVIFVASQEGMEKYKKDWRRIRAAVYDTAGKVYRSKRLGELDQPSWSR